MTQYEKTAIRAVEILKSNKNKSYSSAWCQATSEIISSESSKAKGCPRSAFIALCQLGVVKGIPLNKELYEYDGKCMGYMQKAIKLILKDAKLISSKTKLWSKISNISMQSRLDPLVGLWKKGCINLASI